MSAPFNPLSVSALRDTLGDLSQNQFAGLLGCTADSIRNWEHGRSTPAGHFIDAMHRICAERKIQPPPFYGPSGGPLG